MKPVKTEAIDKRFTKGSGKLTMPEPKIIKWLDIVAKSLAIAQAAWALFEKILG